MVNCLSRFMFSRGNLPSRFGVCSPPARLNHEVCRVHYKAETLRKGRREQVDAIKKQDIKASSAHERPVAISED